MTFAGKTFRNMGKPKRYNQGGAMETTKTPLSIRGLGITSLVFGFLGGAFYWWTPLGMDLSLTGLLLGFVGWTVARRTTTGFGLSVAGMLLSLAALVLDSVIAGYGLELVRFHALR
jgi:hypothetical protein